MDSSPSRVEENAISLPSGEKQGEASRIGVTAPESGSRTAVILLDGTSWSPCVIIFFRIKLHNKDITFRIITSRNKCTHLPSGDTSGAKSLAGWMVKRTVLMLFSARK